MIRADRLALQARQIQRNWEYWCQMVGYPDTRLIEARHDRLLMEFGREHRAWCDEHMDHWEIGIHDHQPWGYDTAITGWRERVAIAAVQIIEHRGGVGEWDVDLGNPGWGLAPAMIHVGEWLWHRLPVLAGLPRRYTGPYLVARLWRKWRGWDVPIVTSL